MRLNHKQTVRVRQFGEITQVQFVKIGVREQIFLCQSENQIVVEILGKPDLRAEQNVHPLARVLHRAPPTVQIVFRARLPVRSRTVKRVVVEVVGNDQGSVSLAQIAIHHARRVHMGAAADLGGVRVQFRQIRHVYLTSMMESSHIAGFS